MKFFLGFLAATLIWAVILALVPMPDEGYKIYDCSIAEFHPDIPTEVREECRKRRMQTRPGVQI